MASGFAGAETGGAMTAGFAAVGAGFATTGIGFATTGAGFAKTGAGFATTGAGFAGIGSGFVAIAGLTSMEAGFAATGGVAEATPPAATFVADAGFTGFFKGEVGFLVFSVMPHSQGCNDYTYVALHNISLSP